LVTVIVVGRVVVIVSFRGPDATITATTMPNPSASPDAMIRASVVARPEEAPGESFTPLRLRGARDPWWMNARERARASVAPDIVTMATVSAVDPIALGP
jgi:hypothetical protein